jgi:hypothetical protein
MMPTLYLTVAQLSKLLDYFPPDEAYLRIQLIQTVFSHVVDLENMYQIYDNQLSPSEKLEVGLTTVLLLNEPRWPKHLLVFRLGTCCALC